MDFKQRWCILNTKHEKKTLKAIKTLLYSQKLKGPNFWGSPYQKKSKVSLEANHHFKNGGSFWKMINLTNYKKWWFGNQPIENGGYICILPKCWKSLLAMMNFHRISAHLGRFERAPFGWMKSSVWGPKNQRLQGVVFEKRMWVFPKKSGFSPQIIHKKIVFSMIFTIHFGVPILLETPMFISLAPKTPFLWITRRDCEAFFVAKTLLWKETSPRAECTFQTKKNSAFSGEIEIWILPKTKQVPVDASNLPPFLAEMTCPACLNNTTLARGKSRSSKIRKMCHFGVGFWGGTWWRQHSSNPLSQCTWPGGTWVKMSHHTPVSSTFIGIPYN